MATNSIQDKISKLLKHANDRQGTAEGESFMQKAMELMAQYGVSESEIHVEEISTQMGKTVVDLSGFKYIKQHSSLLGKIGAALNCYCLKEKIGDTTTIAIYGRSIDRERATMLFSAASPAMIASAMKAVPSGTYRIKLARLSHMEGYSDAIYSSLKKHETATRENHGDSKEIMLADALAAKNYALDEIRNDGKRVRNDSRSDVDYRSYHSGFKEGKRFDTGNTSRLDARRAIGM